MNSDTINEMVAQLKRAKIRPTACYMHPFDYRKFRRSLKTANMVNRLKRIQ